MNIIKERLAHLRCQMRAEEIDYYVIPSDDDHGSEYVGEYFKGRQYISGFTGSAGTAVVWQEGAGLWTDGRYFLQAERQLAGSGIRLFKSGEEGVPDVAAFLSEQAKKGACVGTNGRVISAARKQELLRALNTKGVRLRTDVDLLSRIWTERPPRSCQPVWLLPSSPGDCSVEERLIWLRRKMQEAGAQLLILSALDEIAWLFRLRGADVFGSPLALAYAVIGEEAAYLCLQQEAVGQSTAQALESAGITLRPYDSIYQWLPEICQGKAVWTDPRQLNAVLMEMAARSGSCICSPSPITEKKAVKHPGEIANLRCAHQKDGIAVTRFLYWLKHEGLAEGVTEIGAAKKLEAFRMQQEGYMMPSFAPIMAYGEHGAIVHYEAEEATNAQLRPEGFLLTDTGGHYLEGTTDITRTVALGALSEVQKRHYTLVLAGNLRLASACFPVGVTGENLDILARERLWSEGLDYRHGTGHGVGYLLNVHEGPQAIRWRHVQGKATAPFCAGMVVSDEPGLYLEGEYGIRLENLLVCRSREHSEYGEFLEFETLTMVPFEREAIVPELLGETERRLLNAYHARVREVLLPGLAKEEAEWLIKETEEM